MAKRIADQPTSARDEETPIHELIAAVEALRCEVQILREVLDEFRDDFAWALNNKAFGGPRHFVQVTSMPADPLARDFGDHINRLKPEDVPNPEPPPTSGGSTQRELWG